MQTEIRIYVACLAAYNNGKLHGRWIDANQPTDEIWGEINDVLKTSPEPFAEEWAVHDYEGFGEISLSENPDVGRVSKIAELIEEHGNGFALWYTNQDGHYFGAEELEEKFLEQWQGAHDSKIAFADYLFESTGQLDELPEWARNYFDFGAYARDLELGGAYSFVPHHGQVYVFSNH
jgi:antirestriction protein